MPYSCKVYEQLNTSAPYWRLIFKSIYPYPSISIVKYDRDLYRMSKTLGMKMRETLQFRKSLSVKATLPQIHTENAVVDKKKNGMNIGDIFVLQGNALYIPIRYGLPVFRHTRIDKRDCHLWDILETQKYCNS